MKSLKEEAQAYTPKRTLNIAELERVDISLPMEDRTGMDKEGKEFKYKAMIVNGQEYRVPFTVLDEIKKMLTLKADLTHVNVSQQGSGLNTRYSVSVA